MNLKELRAKVLIPSIGFEDAVQKTVEWEGNTFDVFIKPVMSYADYEFIYTGKGDEDSYAARRIHRFVLLDGGERIPYDDAKQLQPSFIRALTQAINDVHNAKPTDDKKTDSEKKH